MKLQLAVFLLVGGCAGTATVTATTPPPPPPPSGGTVVVTAAPEKHPAYLHALTDLRAARSYLARPAGISVKWDEKRAIGEIDAAIGEIKRASIDDGKNIDDHPATDVPQWGDRLHRSLELVEKARADISKEEDNGFANGLRNRAVGHLDLAVRYVNEGIEDAKTVVVAPPPPPPPAAKHPAYLHALTDLRVARGFLERPASSKVKWDEKRAIREIDAAIGEIKKASVDDGKDIADHPPVDTGMVYGNRLQKAIEMIEKARGDVNEEEDNTWAKGLRNRSISHIDNAVRFINEGIADARKHEPMPPVSPPPPPADNAHPAYLHALTDLRMSRALLERPAKATVKWDENRAIREIDAAIKEIKEASIDDGKNLNDHPAADAAWDHRGRLRRAMELLDGAAKDIEQRETDGFARGLRNRAMTHIRAAAQAIRDAKIDAH
ncbi:MAG TPA: hypothetical protein VGO00_18830 [Kofleriaceae bacterium]|nr:hypothetical protein [Kofleriaceae bacterium]